MSYEEEDEGAVEVVVASTGNATAAVYYGQVGVCGHRL